MAVKVVHRAAEGVVSFAVGPKGVGGEAGGDACQLSLEATLARSSRLEEPAEGQEIQYRHCKLFKESGV